MAPSNKPTKLSVPPQGHRSIIERPASAAVPQLIGKARYRVFASAKLRIWNRAEPALGPKGKIAR